MGKSNKLLAKINPFKYQTSKHIRNETPKKYSNYRRYKPVLKKEFYGRCIYCRKPTLPTDDPSSFHVEHYRPKSKFPNLECEYTNLYYSCAACNRNKGTYLSDTLRVVNPCDYIMSRHLKFKNEEVLTCSKLGEITEKILQLNSTISVSYREYIEIAIRSLVSELIDPPKRMSRVDKLAYAETVKRSLCTMGIITGHSAGELKNILKIKI